VLYPIEPYGQLYNCLSLNSFQKIQKIYFILNKESSNTDYNTTMLILSVTAFVVLIVIAMIIYYIRTENHNESIQ
jgi:hypothetical protein